MRTAYSIALRAIAGCILGLLLSVYVIQGDPRCKNLLEHELARLFGVFFDCRVLGKVESINIFSLSPSITTTNVHVTPKNDNNWEWKCSKFILSISWYDIFFGSKIGVRSDLYSLKARSCMQDGNLSITDHVNNIMKIQGNFPFELRNMQIHKSLFVIDNEQGSLQGSCAFDGELRKRSKRLQAVFYLTDGTVYDAKHVYVADAGLQLSLDTQGASGATLCTGMLRLPFVDQSTPCYFQGSFKDKLGSLRVYNKNGSFVVDRCTFAVTDIGSEFQCDVHLPLGYFYRMLSPDSNPVVHGNCHLRVHATIDDSMVVKSKIDIKNITIFDYLLGDVKANALLANDQIWGALSCSCPKMGSPSGTYAWSLQDNKGSLHIANTLAIEHIANRYWNIAPQDLSITGTFDSRPSFTAHYSGNMTHSKLDTHYAATGELKLDADGIEIAGNVDDIRYACQAVNLHHLYLKHLLVTQSDKNIVSLSSNDMHEFEGVLSYDGVRSLAKKIFDYNVQGEGSIDFQGKLIDNNIAANITMKKGNIRIGNTYNFVQNFSGRVKACPQKRELSLINWTINLHRGSLLIPYARCQFDEHQHIRYCYIPLHVRNVFLNNERDVFILVSGRLAVIQEQGARPVIRGRLCIDRGQIRHNIFSSKEQKNILKALSQALIGSSQDVEFDITIDTRHPVHVQTTFLESEIKIQLSIQGSLQHPQVSGKILIPDGTFHFPYRPLKITHGALYVMPHNLDDPAIELHAKGRIKRYWVSMYVHGTLLDPHITFVSTPPLAQEQIITLLLGGSETGALSLVMPSLVVQNVQNLIFGSGQVSPTVEKYILSPLRYIRIVPSFTDQAGRGGFRGAIEIDVTDQLRAVIQKNFSLSEDTRFEVEYQISDEISLRGIRDERSDIGGEIEARFTF